MKCFWPPNTISKPIPGCSLRRIWLLTSHELDAAQELLGVVGFENEIVRSALESADDVLGIGTEW